MPIVSQRQLSPAGLMKCKKREVSNQASATINMLWLVFTVCVAFCWLMLTHAPANSTIKPPKTIPDCGTGKAAPTYSCAWAKPSKVMLMISNKTSADLHKRNLCAKSLIHSLSFY